MALQALRNEYENMTPEDKCLEAMKGYKYRLAVAKADKGNLKKRIELLEEMFLRIVDVAEDANK